MTSDKFDAIIIGGSYSGLAAGMALGRALKKVLIIDSGKPCNRFTPHSHNFITHDGRVPSEIAVMARQQVEKYSTVEFFMASLCLLKRMVICFTSHRNLKYLKLLN